MMNCMHLPVLLLAEFLSSQQQMPCLPSILRFSNQVRMYLGFPPGHSSALTHHSFFCLVFSLGRFENVVYVGLPNATEREAILETQRKKMPWSQDVDLARLVEDTDGANAASMVALCQAAAIQAMQRVASDASVDEQVGKLSCLCGGILLTLFLFD